MKDEEIVNRMTSSFILLRETPAQPPAPAVMSRRRKTQ